ncbi:hypothetical protein OG946_29385 [Streptomyces sp. NBC_01808]|uniref:hypothetical protein n=1 Tax=Streptomyces sp. NBC_01808 TaxID=2975947 RepID=UPI002DD8B378|nr:hypothetical protein [Streptomyces sp. NBC_01808]WSA41131.1 hypothetical protein OG946_29385 [Streptomyces sp. NBC_01808]
MGCARNCGGHFAATAAALRNLARVRTEEPDPLPHTAAEGEAVPGADVPLPWRRPGSR